MKEVFAKRQYIIETAEKFYYTNIKIYPDTEEKSLFLLVEYNSNTKSSSNLEAALESYLRRELKILVSVVPVSKLNVLQRDGILSKCINFGDDYNEKLIEEKFCLPINDIIFKEAKEENIDDVSIFLAERQVKKFDEIEKNKDRKITEMQKNMTFNSMDNKRKSPPKEDGEKLFNKALSESDYKKIKLDDVAMEIIQEFISGYEEAAKKSGITIKHQIYIEPMIDTRKTF